MNDQSLITPTLTDVRQLVDDAAELHILERFLKDYLFHRAGWYWAKHRYIWYLINGQRNIKKRFYSLHELIEYALNNS
jgi:hypothetical protein